MSTKQQFLAINERLEILLQGIDLAKLRNGNQEECYKFYEQNYGFIKGMALRFCRKELNYQFQDLEDLIQEIYVNLPNFDYSSYKTLCYTLWRVLLLLTRSGRAEHRCLHLDAPISTDNKHSIYSVIPYPEKDFTYSNDTTLAKLIEWLKKHLKPNDFEYVYMRYIEFATNDEILTALNYSLLNQDSLFDRRDFRIMQELREKYADLVAYVGGIFANYQNILPAAIEKRKQYMSGFKICLFASEL